MKHSNSHAGSNSTTQAAFSHSPFQALSLGSDGAIALKTDGNNAGGTNVKEEAKAPSTPLPTLKVRTVRRPQPLIKKQPVRLGSNVKLSIAPATIAPDKASASENSGSAAETQLAAHRVVAQATVSQTLAPSAPVKLTVVPGKVASAPAIFGQMQTALQNRTSVTGIVTQVVDDGKGRIFGVRVKLENTDVLAFAPFSRLGLAITEVHGLLNTTQAFKVITVDEAKGAIVFNRQAACSELRLDRLIELVKVGQVLTGKVRNIADCGAFVEITGSGASGLIHISKLPGQSLEAVKKGQEVKVTVVKVNKAKHQLGLALAEVQ